MIKQNEKEFKKTNNLSITIIGCGWLGLPLGKALAEEQQNVFGSTRKSTGFDALREVGISPFKLNLDESTEIPNKIIASTQILVITLPPLHRDNPEKYKSLLTKLLSQFNSNVRVIFTSSSGIYPQVAGNFVESFEFNPEQESSVLNVAEDVIRSSEHPHVIFRLGGLIGPNRHPIRFLAGRENVKNPEGPINFVHQGDCIRAIRKVIGNTEIRGTFNLIYPNHPSRKEYYTNAAEHYGLQLPSFNEDSNTLRFISSQKIIRKMGFEFKFPIDLFPKLNID